MAAAFDVVLDFWFGAPDDDALVANRQAHLWWSKDEDVDAAMRDCFGSLVAEAAAGKHNDWCATPRGRLALILLTDQFPRNIWRDTPASFSLDELARQLCKDGLAAGDDQSLRPVERVFFYLPLEHSEDQADQALSVAKFRELASLVPVSLMKPFGFFLTYANRHQEVIEQFGRFPHRNRILGRVNTVEEAAYLKGPGAGF